MRMKTENEITVRTKSCDGCRVEKMPLVEMQDAFTRLIAERKTDNENKTTIDADTMSRLQAMANELGKPITADAASIRRLHDIAKEITAVPYRQYITA